MVQNGMPSTSWKSMLYSVALTLRPSSATGLKSKPTDQVSAVSGFRFGWPPAMTTAGPGSAPGGKNGKNGRICSRESTVATFESARLGAWNDLPLLARNEKPSTTFQLRPNFGLVVSPKSL